MSALLFGSISTIADTSELQREAYNRAFEAHGLEWNWDRDRYRSMLDSSGGKNRKVTAAVSSVGADWLQLAKKSSTSRARSSG